MNKVAGRLEGRYKLKLKWNDQVLSWIHKRIDHVESGARLIDAVINTEILSPLSTALFGFRETFSNEIHIRLSDDGKPIFASGAGSDTVHHKPGESSVQPPMFRKTSSLRCRSTESSHAKRNHYS